MRWLQSEYALKGVFLGLWFFVALQAPSWQGLGQVAAYTGGGLAIALVLGVLDQLRRGQKFGGNLVAYGLFLLLEYPMLVYAGLIAGLAFGALSVQNEALLAQSPYLLSLTAGGGAIMGLVISQLLAIERRDYRRYGILLAAALGLSGVIYFLNTQDFFELDRSKLGLQLLIGLPFFYLLVFSGTAEESEVEIGLICIGIGLSAWLMRDQERALPGIAFLIPVLLYVAYSIRVLPGLRVFKYVLRGQSYLSMGRIKLALFCFRRALQLDPKSELAKSGMWQLHLGLDVHKIQDDPEMLAQLDLQLCLNRARDLVLGDGVPNDRQLDEARRLLDLVESQRPKLRAEIQFYRAVAAAHAKQLALSGELLNELFDAQQWPEKDPARQRVILKAWLLVLLWHRGLKSLVGQPQLQLPGRRMEAIAAIERAMAESLPEVQDPSVTDLRAELYQGLTEDEYQTFAGPAESIEFNHEYVEQLGQKLIGNPELWQQGASFLRIAAKGLLPRSPLILQTLAQAYERVGDHPAVKQYLQQIIKSGLTFGVGSLETKQKEIYFSTVKRLAEDAEAKSDWPTAIHNWNLYTQSEQCGLETFRKLAQLHELNGDALAALRLTETALTYSGKDADLLARKDKYYYSVTADELKSRVDEVRSYFDSDYCIRKAKQLLDSRNPDQETLEWAEHLSKLARLFQPKSLVAMMLAAKLHLRFGERDAALSLLEDIHEAKHSGTDEEDAWYWSCQTLGRLYLDELERPDLAIAAFNDFRNSTKSGADTIYNLARAYEATGNLGKASQCYEQVTAYETHPLAIEARTALYRLKQARG